MLLLATPPADRHSVFEDAQGIVIGATLVALSIQFLRASDLFTGQIAGLALILAYPTGYSFGLLFFLLNLPFYVLAVIRLGWRFTLKSLAAVSVMSLVADGLPLVLTINTLPDWLGAALFGILAGVGLVSLFRHGATLGGVGIVALWLQDTRGIKAGNTQLAVRPVRVHRGAFPFSLAGCGMVSVWRSDPEWDHDHQPPPRPIHRAVLKPACPAGPHLFDCTAC